MNGGLNALNITGIDSARVDYNATFNLYQFVNETLLSNETSSVLTILETSCPRIIFQSYSCSQNLWSDNERKRLCSDFYRDNCGLVGSKGSHTPETNRRHRGKAQGTKPGKLTKSRR